ncbi:MAG: biotin-dependent carboxyltransferase family protein [Marinosulfonomonas sp.]
MIEVVSIPPLATVQDLGRDGYWGQGLGRAGAMDPMGHRLANMMLGNDADAATLEIPLTPAKFTFTARTAFALVGAACGARLDGALLPRAFAGIAESGQMLELGPMTKGARLSLALAGGIDVAPVLGSRSTQLREAFGGFDGRVLAQGDRLSPLSDVLPVLPKSGISLALPARDTASGDIVVRALPSAEHDSFSPDARAAFWSAPYTITPQSNRQGYRFEGPELTRSAQGELRSHGIVPGIVQVPSGGQPIIQLADSATMGGYPKIAAVIEQDLWKIGQARAGDQVRFEQVTLQDAAQAVAQEAKILAQYRDDLDAMLQQQKGWV